jgi:type IV pilus assembly protein PilY1
VPFRLANLDATRIGQLGATLTERTDVLNYLRGDRSLERQNGGPYRVRGGVLGDVVSSAPFYVAAPLFRYSDSIAPAPYSAFVAANSGRQPMVYVGANDGMLHAFSVDSSGAGAVAEEFAFIPSPVFRNMKNLTDINYTHQFYVDGTPTVVDAYLEDLGGTPASKWRTVLVGGLGKGGQGVYALDVTNPANLTESQASNIKLWEFTDADDADLGYTYSRPAIVKLHNGKWAAVFGNGYNNTASPAGDTHVSSTGNAALYFVNIATGALMKKITVPVGMAQDPLSQSRPNGLGTPAMVDIDGDRVVDRAYVGDIFGNMWKFDLTDVNEVNWDVAMTDAVSGAPIPLFVARNAAGGVQPITTRPQVTRAPKGRGMIILFGTGKFMEAIDRDPASVVPQSFYGLYDNGEATTIARTSLLQQTILAEVSSDPDGDGNFTRFRVTSNNPLLSNQKGWYMNLLAPPNVFEGEMQVTDPGLRNGRVVFTTLIPDPNPCSKGGKSWVLDLNAYTGSRSAFTPADINGDRLFNTADFLTIGGVGTVAISGIGDNNISSAFRFISGGADDPSDYGIGTTTGGTANVFRFNPGPGAVGRQSWRQLR